ncbi:MAG TPA: RNase J family beta-CASP ribonuclease [Ruminococcaceae bacterium]|nr:RNase J family beta-CASP ribonuclease [Oscillospiraceae bacterium]
MRSEEAAASTVSEGERSAKPAAAKTGNAKKPAAKKNGSQPKSAQQKPAQPTKNAGGKKAGEGQKAASKQAKSASPKAKAENKPKQQPKAAAKNESQKAAQSTKPKNNAENGKKQDAAKQNAPKNAAAAAQQPNRSTRRGKKTDGTRRPPLRIISLGGLGEIGKNITVFETDQDILVADCGSAFPDDDLPGVDLVIPDFTYLEKNASKIRGIFITHGHEDHIGSLPFLLKQVKAPVYGTAFTMGLISGKLKEHGILNQCKLNTVKPGDTIKAGSTMSVEFVRVNHSIPDACALAIRTPAGLVVFTGDFKVDFTPISGEPIDLVRFGELGSEGVLALLSDSTNAEKPGSTPSERIVGESFDKLFKRAAEKRIIIATFASNVHRIQQVVDTAVKFDRKVAVFGRSMVNVVAIAQELGYLTIPDGILIDADNLKDYTDEEIVLITTGSQGEPMSALTRMSIGSHRNIKIGPNDCIIISATPIPGNEKSVGKVVNELMKLGADVIYERMYDVHVSGHACQDETRLLLSLTQPKFFMPVHGEYKHLMKNAGVGASMGIPEENIIISDIGKVVETDGVEMKITGMVPSGRVLVDGLGVGDVGSVVLRDRKLLADDGLIVVVCAINDATGEVLAGPDLVSRGFVYVRDNEDLMADATVVVRNSLEKCKLNGFRDWASIKGRIRDELGDFIASRTRRKPVILPIIQEV